MKRFVNTLLLSGKAAGHSAFMENEKDVLLTLCPLGNGLEDGVRLLVEDGETADLLFFAVWRVLLSL